jgi:hypothetical protein
LKAFGKQAEAPRARIVCQHSRRSNSRFPGADASGADMAKQNRRNVDAPVPTNLLALSG